MNDMTQTTLLEKMMADAQAAKKRLRDRDGVGGWPQRKPTTCEVVQARRKRVLEAFENGETHTQIAERMGMNRNTVKMDIMYARGGKPIVRRRGVTEDDNAEIIRLRNEGLTYREIAREMGLREGAICHRIKVLREKGVDV